MPDVESVWHKGHGPYLLRDEKEGILRIVNHSSRYEPPPYPKARPSHEGMGIEIQVVVVFFAEGARLLGKPEKRREPALLVLWDLLQNFFCGLLALLGQGLPLHIQVKIPPLLQEELNACYDRCGILHPGRQVYLAHALHAPSVLIKEDLKLFKPFFAGFISPELGEGVLRLAVENDIGDTHFPGLFGELPEFPVHLEYLIVKTPQEIVKGGMGVVYAKGILAYVLKEDKGSVDAVHHVHVNLPHAPADIYGVLEVRKKLSVAGRIYVAGLQLFVMAQHLIYIIPP